MPEGTVGTVIGCDDGGNVFMDWRGLPLRPEVDDWEIIDGDSGEK